MIEKLRNLVSGDETKHPTLEESGGCIDAWICYQMREEDDGREVCAGCGRVLIHDTTAFKHDPDRMPGEEDDE